MTDIGKPKYILAMARIVLSRAREGVRKKRYTVSQLAAATGIPQNTLSEMLQDRWGRRVFDAIDRLERLNQVMDTLDRQKREDA